MPICPVCGAVGEWYPVYKKDGHESNGYKIEMNGIQKRIVFGKEKIESCEECDCLNDAKSYIYDTKGQALSQWYNPTEKITTKRTDGHKRRGNKK